jgi:SAM-dependent methyltransferase
MQTGSTIGSPLRSAQAPAPPRLLRPLFDQFARPTGWLGRLAGRLMAKSDADDRWIVKLLDVQPDDRVLDVGCGPGVAVDLIAQRVSAGIVRGVDPSVVMLRQAARRNRAAIQAGRVELRRGSAASVPYPDGHFTRVCTLHTLYFWPSIEAGLREIRRVLAPGGRLVIAVRTRHEEAGILDPSRYGYSDAQLTDLESSLRRVGFEATVAQRRAIGRETIAAISARR